MGDVILFGPDGQADAGIAGDGPGPFELIFYQVFKFGGIGGVVHGADEIEIAFFAPEFPVLAEVVAVHGPVGENGGGDFYMGADFSGFFCQSGYYIVDLLLSEFYPFLV